MSCSQSCPMHSLSALVCMLSAVTQRCKSRTQQHHAHNSWHIAPENILTLRTNGSLIMQNG